MLLGQIYFDRTSTKIDRKMSGDWLLVLALCGCMHTQIHAHMHKQRQPDIYTHKHAVKLTDTRTQHIMHRHNLCTYIYTHTDMNA